MRYGTAAASAPPPSATTSQMSCLRYRPCSVAAEAIDVALKTNAIPMSASVMVAKRSGRSTSPALRRPATSAARHHAETLRGSRVEECLQDLLRDRCRGGAAVARVLDHHRDRDAGMVHRRETDEERVVVSM